MSLESSAAIATDGTQLQLDSLPHVYTYNASNQILTDTVTELQHSYQQTYTYTNNLISNISAWVKIS